MFWFSGRARCSHFQSACFFSVTVARPDELTGRPCTATCPKPNRNSWGYLPGRTIPMGEDAPETLVNKIKLRKQNSFM